MHYDCWVISYCWNRLIEDRCLLRYLDSCLIHFNRKVNVSWLADYSCAMYYMRLLVGEALEIAIGKHRGWPDAVAVFAASTCLVVYMQGISSLKEFVR